MILKIKFRETVQTYTKNFLHKTGLPHFQGNSESFQVEENIRETKEVLIYILDLGKLREVLILLKSSGKL